MFTWICPKCGREVPPSSDECPNCAGGVQKQPDEQPAPVAAAEAPPARPRAANRVVGRLPGWLLALLSAIGFLALGFAGFTAYTRLSGGSAPAARSTPPPDQSKAAAPATAATNVLLDYIEVTGFRVVEDSSERVNVRFVVVNHAQAPIVDLAGEVTLRPTTAKPGAGNAVGSFTFRLPEIAPLEIRDMTAPLDSKLRVYELPDWEFLRADLKLTTPQKKP